MHTHHHSHIITHAHAASNAELGEKKTKLENDIHNLQEHLKQAQEKANDSLLQKQKELEEKDDQLVATKATLDQTQGSLLQQSTRLSALLQPCPPPPYLIPNTVIFTVHVDACWRLAWCS